MQETKPQYKYGLYKNNTLIHSFDNLPDLLSFFNTDTNELTEGWKEMIKQDESIELRDLKTGAVIFSSSAVGTPHTATQKAVWATQDGTMPALMKHLFTDSNKNELPDMIENMVGNLFDISNVMINHTTHSPKSQDNTVTKKYTTNVHDLSQSSNQQPSPLSNKPPKYLSTGTRKSMLGNAIRIFLLVTGLLILATLFLF